MHDPAVEGRLDDASLTVVSNREPYVHGYDGEETVVSRPAGGLVTALSGVVGATGGTWVAWGSGDADFDDDVAPDGRVEMPPEDPAFTLSRVHLSRSEVDGYYYGYSNQVLWPLCHLDTNYVHVDPEFFPTYERVNRRFADRVVETDPDAVWFQDYHLALAPRFVRERVPEARLAHFWHIPWPPAEVCRISPHAEDLVGGLLANDAVGFHTDGYAENFLDCVAAEVPGARVERGSLRGRGVGRVVRTSTVTGDTHETEVYASAIGADTDQVLTDARTAYAERYWQRLVDRQGLDTDRTLALGVDRLDYTKGIVERLDALDHLWSNRPDLREELTFVQKATRTRERIPSYRRYHGQVRDRIYELNRVHGTDDWTPVVYIEEEVDGRALAGLYRNADLAVVSSRKDGMNLVAKEFVAASEGVGGRLVLSTFAGAAGSLCPHALEINPFDVAGFADTIAEAVEMGDDEADERFESLIRAVREKDIHAWMADQLAVLDGE